MADRVSCSHISEGLKQSRRMQLRLHVLVLSIAVGLAFPGGARAATSPATISLNNCQNQVRTFAKAYLQDYVGAVGTCLQAISAQIIKTGSTTTVNKAAGICVTQFRRLNDSRVEGKSLAEKLAAKIDAKCLPGLHTLPDILGTGAGVTQPLRVEDLGPWCAQFGGNGSITSLGEWTDCINASQTCAARSAISTQYPRVLEWLGLVRDAMDALPRPETGDTTKIDDALAGLDAVVAALDGPNHDGVVSLQCGSVVDLSGVNLAGQNLAGKNLTGVNLTGADLSNTDLTDVILTGANLTGANLSSAVLTGMDLSRMNLTNTNLINANLSGAKLYKTNLTNANLTNANLTGVSDDIDNGYPEVNLTNANLTNANLSGAMLEVANLTGANLTGASVTGANLAGGILTGADLTGVNLTGAILIRADLAGMDLSGRDLTDARLSYANLTGANLAGATLIGADLLGVNLTSANLTNALLGFADLTEANLTNADLTGATVAVIWSNTTCPDASNSDGHGASCCSNMNGKVLAYCAP